MPFRLREIQRAFSIRGFYTAFPIDWDDTFVFHGENHDFWEIVFLEQGDVECIEDENVYLLKGNCMLLHSPMEFHRIRSSPGSSPKGFILSFKTEGELPKRLRQGIFLLEEAEKEEYRSLCKIIQKVVLGTQDPYLSQLAADRLSSFLIQLSEKPVTTQIVCSNRSESYRRIVSDMTECVDRNLSLKDFANRQNISVSYLKLLFQEYAGISPKTYYNQLRIQRAIKLLNTPLSIAEISEMMNFSSQNYFTIFFTRYMGQAPSEFRKNTAFRSEKICNTPNG